MKKGSKMTEEQRKKLSEAHKGIIPSSRKGILHTAETKRKMSEAHKKWVLEHKGEKKIYSEEQLKKMSEAQKKVWANPEYKKKMSEAHRGKKLSEEQKIKISESLKGKTVSEKTRKKLSEVHKGKRHSEETIRKQKESLKKRLLNPEFRKKLSEAHKGQIPWNSGKKGIYSEETRRKIGLASKGRKLSEEHKRKISSSLMGREVSNETREKIGISNKGKLAWNKGVKTGQIPWIKGKTHSEETREKLRKVNLGRIRSEETKKKISLTKKGTKAWNKGKKIPEISGENHPMFGKTHSEKSKLKMSETHKKTMSNPEFRKRLSEIHNKRLSNPEEMKRQSETSTATLLRLYESGKFPRQENTKPERQIKEELLKRGYKEIIDFIHQYKFRNKFMCDFCFPKQKVIVEAYGDFWHGNPIKYAGKKLHKHQIKGINRDKSKEAYITKVDNHSWTYLVLWESDIKKDVAKCVDRIEKDLSKKK